MRVQKQTDDKDSAENNGGDTASRGSALVEQSLEQDISHQSLDLLQKLIGQSRIHT